MMLGRRAFAYFSHVRSVLGLGNCVCERYLASCFYLTNIIGLIFFYPCFMEVSDTK